LPDVKWVIQLTFFSSPELQSGCLYERRFVMSTMTHSHERHSIDISGATRKKMAVACFVLAAVLSVKIVMNISTMI